MILIKRILLLVIIVLSVHSFAQNTPSLNARFKDGLKIYLNDDSTRWVKGTGMAQIWLRYNDNNPGSTIYGTPVSTTFDVGIRRARYQVLSQVNKKVFFYTQIGINSYNSLTSRKTPIFFHDATAEYDVYKKCFTLGGGLSGWNGTSRYTSSGVTNILAMDLPYYQETFNDITDQFVRKLGVYAKGQIGRLDYRYSVANPFPIQNTVSGTGTSTSTLNATDTNISYYSTRAPKMLHQGYLFWQFMDKESNQVPYMAGSYLGKKRILNLGTGFAYQQDAMWNRNTKGDTVSTAIQQIGADVFFDYYLNKEKQTAITAYASFTNFDFGPNYVRNTGPMNTANGVNSKKSFNGQGSNAPMYGTGQVMYAQAAYLFKKDLLKTHGTLQPYGQFFYGNFQRLKDPVVVYNIGFNWIQGGQNSKMSIDYQSRPIFNTDINGNIVETKSARRGMVVLQYQVAF